MTRTRINILSLFLIFLAISCGENPTNNVIINTGTISFKVTGNVIYDFNSKNVRITQPDSSNSYLTVYGSQSDSKGSISFVVRIIATINEVKDYEITNDNSISVSFYNGAESYKSVSGTLKILEWNNNLFKATFNASLEKIDNKEEILFIGNGEIEIES